MMDPIFANLAEHASLFLGGAAGFSVIAHAVQTFPTPKSPIGAWLLGVVQFAVGQRERAANTLQGYQTTTVEGQKATEK